MFENISVMPHPLKKQLDIGDLAEKMLYYKQVHLFVGREELKKLYEFADIDLIIELIKTGILKLNVEKKHYGVGKQENGLYIADFFYKQNFDLKEFLFETYLEFSGDKEKSRAVASKLYRHVGIFDLPNAFVAEIESDLKDDQYVRELIKENIHYYYPHEQIDASAIDFSYERVDEQFIKINSNVDFNKYQHLDLASVLLNIGTAYNQMKIISNYDSELAAPEINSRIIGIKLNSLIKKSINSQNELNVFQHAVFHNAPTIKEVINCKERTLKEFLGLLAEAEKFKRWLNDVGEGGNLINEYNNAINKKKWVQSDQSKAIRFYLFQGVGAILKGTAGSLTGLLASLGLSAFNTFLLEKLWKEWRPNHFIEDEVKDFTKTNT